MGAPPPSLPGPPPRGGAARAAGAFTTAFREQFGAEGLEAAVAPHLAAAPLLAPAFAALLRGEPPPRGTEPFTKETLQAAFTETTRSLGREHPVILVIDDLHFAPDEGRGLFAALAAAVPGHRVLLVGTSRPGLPAEWTAELDRRGGTSRLGVGRLGPKDLHRLLVEAFRSERLAEELGGRIGAKSDGNPFFAFEILRSLREGGALRRGSDGTWVKTSEIREIEIPSTVAELIRARTGRLDEGERNLLDVAACCGFEFDPLLVGEVLGLGRIPVLQKLAGIEKAHRLVRSAGRRFVFDHHQVQEVLHASLPELLREEYHGAVGEALEKREGAAGREPKDLPGGVALALCRHFLEGGRGAAADRYLDAALKHLEKEYLAADAVVLLERAIARTDPPAARRVDLRLRQTRWLEPMGRNAEWRAAVDDAFLRAEAGGDPASRILVRSAKARLLNRLGDHDPELVLLEEALSMARSAAEKRLEAGVHHGLASHHHARNRPAEALESHRRALALAIEAGDGEFEEMESANVGAQLNNLGRYGEAIPHIERALAYAVEKGARRFEQGALTNLSIALNRIGRYEEALPSAERSVELACGIGDLQGEVSALGALSHTLWNLGDLEGSLAHRERQVDRGKALGHPKLVVLSLLNLGSLLLDLGAVDRASGLLEEALPSARGAGMKGQESSLLRSLARATEARGEVAEAERLYRESLALREGTGSSGRDDWTLLSLGWILQAGGREAEARGHFEEVLAHSGVAGDRVDAFAALASLATLPGGDPAAAEEAFRAMDGRHSPVLEARLRFLLWRATGDREALDEAHRLLLSLRDRVPPEHREGFMTRVPLHREIAAAWEGHRGAPGSRA